MKRKLTTSKNKKTNNYNIIDTNNDINNEMQ